MKKSRNQIAKVLMKNGLKPNYKQMQSEELPRSVFFLVSNLSDSASNEKYVKKYSYQISIFSKDIEDDLMNKIEADFTNLNNCFVSDWQEGPIEDEINFIHHFYLEVEFIEQI